MPNTKTTIQAAMLFFATAYVYTLHATLSLIRWDFEPHNLRKTTNTVAVVGPLSSNAGADDSSPPLSYSAIDANNQNTHQKQKRPSKSIINTKEAGACLLIKDDNPRLIEWLAYHYQVLPLRHLIIASDPTALTSPTVILDRWRKKLPNLQISEWADEEYGSQKRRKNREKKLEGKGKPADRMTHQLLMMRQKQFYSDCVLTFKEQGLSWVFLTDTDEYVVFNQLHEDDPTKMDEIVFARQVANSSHNITEGDMDQFLRTRMKQTAHKVEQFDMHLDSLDFHSVEERYLKLRQGLPAIGEETVMNYIQRLSLSQREARDVQQKHKHKQHLDDTTRTAPYALPLFEDDPCHIMPRLFHSSIEPSPEELSRAITFKVPLKQNGGNGNNGEMIFNPVRFDTLRYLHNVPKGAYDYNTFGKAALDVSRISEDDLVKFRGVHRPIKQCRKAYEEVYYSEALLRVNHYLGSWEAYSVKGDKRRTREKYDERSGLDAGVMYDAQPWLRAFVNDVGLENAQYLLQGVGDYSELSQVYADAVVVQEDGNNVILSNDGGVEQ